MSLDILDDNQKKKSAIGAECLPTELLKVQKEEERKREQSLMNQKDHQKRKISKMKWRGISDQIKE
jgi:hypothetical protein